MDENAAATTEASEQSNEVDVATPTEATGDSVAASPNDESSNGGDSTDVSVNEPSENTDSNEPSANAENAAPSTDGSDSADNAENDNSPAVSEESNGTGATESDGNENSEATTAEAIPEDSPSNENAESGDNTDASPGDNNAPESGDSSSSSSAGATTVAPDDGAASEQPSTAAPEFKCDSVGRFECPHSCEKYYFCWDTTGDHAVFSCPHHKAFDPVTQLCVHNYAVCAAAPKCEVDRQIVSDPNDKASFFECRLNESDDDDDESTETFEVRKQECAEGREFDADLGYCALIPQEDDGSTDESTAEKQDCTQVGISIDFANESRYFECIVKNVAKGKLKLIHHKCPKYHVFSMEDKKCIPLLPVAA